MKHYVSIVALALAPALAAADTVSVETFRDKADVKVAPEKVVAFDLAAIDTLHALGVTVDGVPAFGPPAFLEDAMGGVDTMGSLFEPDLEKLATFGPDLIIAGGRSSRAYDALSEVAPTVDMTIWGEDILAQAKARTTAYGEIFDKADEAQAVLASWDAKIDAAKAASKGKGAALIVMANGGKLSAYGDDSRFGWLHTAIDLPEAFPAVTAETHGESISFEFIADVNPEWILVVDRLAAIGRDGEAAAVTLDNPLVAGTTAGQKGQIIYLDSAPLYLASGGAKATEMILDQLIDGFGG